MAYQTNTVSNSDNLKTTIENFCVANGWTLSGSGILYKGDNFVRISRTIPNNGPPTISHSGTTAIVTAYGHMFAIGDSITVSGVTGVDAGLYNGTFTVTNISGNNTFNYTMTNTPTANAVGTIEIIGGTTTLCIQGASASDGTGLTLLKQGIYIPTISWPVTYYLYANTSPDVIHCVLQYETNKCQHIIFGDIVKINNSAYTGGNFVFGTKSYPFYGMSVLGQITDTDLTTNSDGSGFASAMACMFNGATSVTQATRSLHAEIDGNSWGTVPPISGGAIGKVSVTDYVVSQLFRSPNTWNNQTQLVPIHLQFSCLSSFYSYLGYIEHLRYIRVDNFEAGDTITLGSDTWDIFPCFKKNASSRNLCYSAGVEANAHTGTVGFAIRHT